MPQQHGPFGGQDIDTEVLVIQTIGKDLGFYLLDFLNKALQRNIKRRRTHQISIQIEDQQLV